MYRKYEHASKKENTASSTATDPSVEQLLCHNHQKAQVRGSALARDLTID